MTDQPVPAPDESGEALTAIPALTEDEYLAEVLRSAPSSAVLAQPCDALVLGALGLAAEAGEVADLVRKHRSHTHPLNRAALLDELGEVVWALTWLCHVLETSLGAVMLSNLTRLRARFAADVDQEHDKKE